MQQFHILLNYQLAALSGWEESNVSTFLFQVHPFITVGAVLSVFIAIKNRDKKFIVISWMLILVFLFQIQRIRYLLIVFPMLALVSAYALSALNSHRLKLFIAYGVAFSSYVMALVIGLSFLPSISANNIKLAGEYLNTTNVKIVEVMVLPQTRSIINPEISVPVLDYHTNKRLVYNRSGDDRKITVPENVHVSPVKFTWDYTMPEYYSYESHMKQGRDAIALVYSSAGQLDSNAVKSALSGYRLVKEFSSQSKIFKYKTLVNVYLPVKT